MRMIAGSLKDAFHIHKTHNEYLADIGEQPWGLDKYCMWTHLLSDPKRRYVLLMHGRKPVGMIWGRDEVGEFIVEGRFLRRAYRGKLRFTKELYKAKVEITKGYDTIKEVRPAISLGKRKIKYVIL
jgi:hypothetical protein